MAAPARWAIRSAPPAHAIIVTLIGALRKHGKKRGVASLCIGGGEATAVGIELA
jgi:acetyl-CoA acetyltransferase